MNKKRLIVLAALVASALATTSSTAGACGGYGDYKPPTAERVAESEVFAALARHRVTKYVSGVDVALTSARRGVATIRYRNGRTLEVGLFRYQGRWVVTARPRPRARHQA